MDQSLAMDHIEGLGELDGNPTGQLLGHPSLPAQQMGQVLPLEKLLHEVVPTVLGDHLVDPGDAGMIEPGHGSGLAKEALPLLGSPGKRRDGAP